MKITEVKSAIDQYSVDQLKLIVTEMYKSIPKTVKENKDIDSIIKNPELSGQSGKKTTAVPDIKVLENEALLFIENAYDGHYCFPNKIIRKADRPKWRFLVKRFFKELTLASSVEGNLSKSSHLLEKLYELICHSCSYMLFNSYDSFESIGIEQNKFFYRILALKFQTENKNDFITNALNLMINNSLNRYTLYSDLMYSILEFLKTPDMKNIAIEKCNELMEVVKKEAVSKDSTGQSEYKKKENLNNLTEMGFLCYSRLYEYDNAIQYYKINYIGTNSEVKLYILLKLLFFCQQHEHFLKEYDRALNDGIQPRERLVKTYNYIKANNKFPDYFY